MKPFYTIIESDGRFWIRFVEPPDWTEREWPGVGAFDDPAEAGREFKAAHAQFRAEKPLHKSTFDRRILRHEQDMVRFLSWSKG